MSPEFYKGKLIPRSAILPDTDTGDTGGGNETIPYSPTNPSPNFSYTKDPNVNIGKYGVKITKDDMAAANKNGMGWNDFNEFSHWLGGFAHNPVDYDSVSPYYRTYPNGNINGADIAVLKAKGDPKIDAIIARNIASPGEVPMFGPEDSDMLKKLISVQNSPSTGVDYTQLVKPK
jgi:hypothetical protein